MGVMKTMVRQLCPPIIWRWASQIRGYADISFEGNYATWIEAQEDATGYDAEEILAKVLAATLKVKQGEAAFERDSVLFDKIEYVWPVLAGIMWAAARSGGRLNVLDFGGALGSSYFQNRKFLQTLTDVRWSVVEQPHYVEVGRKYIQNEQLRFYESIEECVAENQPNMILLSSVLQYLESPTELVGKLNKVAALCLVVERTPFSLYEKKKLVIQRVPAAIYSASYPMWIFSLPELKQHLEESWSLVAYLNPDGHVRTTNGDDFSFQGMLLESRR